MDIGRHIGCRAEVLRVFIKRPNQPETDLRSTQDEVNVGGALTVTMALDAARPGRHRLYHAGSGAGSGMADVRVAADVPPAC